jgi:hypothetical protein
MSDMRSGYVFKAASGLLWISVYYKMCFDAPAPAFTDTPVWLVSVTEHQNFPSKDTV